MMQYRHLSAYVTNYAIRENLFNRINLLFLLFLFLSLNVLIYTMILYEVTSYCGNIYCNIHIIFKLILITIFISKVINVVIYNARNNYNIYYNYWNYKITEGYSLT